MERILDKITDIVMRLMFFSVALVVIMVMWMILFAMVSSGVQARELPPQQFDCLARAVYWEARGEPIEGQLEVAHVVLNRVRDERFPNTPCAVVHQRRGKVCQFEWACTDRRHVRPVRGEVWQQVRRVARMAVRQNPGIEPGTLYFRARGSRRTGWWRSLYEVAEIGGHTFYAD